MWPCFQVIYKLCLTNLDSSSETACSLWPSGEKKKATFTARFIITFIILKICLFSQLRGILRSVIVGTEIK